VLDAYGWRCELAASDRLGGLRVTIAPGGVRKLERPERTS
jgi:hypothetical protein